MATPIQAQEPSGLRLGAAGHQRTERLAERLANARVRAAFATEYRRTQETAAPLARQEGLEVAVVPCGRSPLGTYVGEMAAQVRARLDAAEFEPAEGAPCRGP